MIGAVLVLAAIATAVAPSIGGQVDDLGTGVQDGVRQATDVLAEKPFNLSKTELRDRVDEAIARVRENSSGVTQGLTTGAVLLGEVLTGLIVTLLLTFFFLSDGRGMWDWLVGLAAPGHRRGADELGARVFAALSGYIRGIALVGLVDAILIGIALLIIGVPLVIPLMILTFLGAFMPLIGAFLAGLAAVLIALVSNGVVAALLVLGGDHPRPAGGGPPALPAAHEPDGPPPSGGDHPRARDGRRDRRHHRRLPRRPHRRRRLHRHLVRARRAPPEPPLAEEESAAVPVTS